MGHEPSGGGNPPEQRGTPLIDMARFLTFEMRSNARALASFIRLGGTKMIRSIASPCLAISLDIKKRYETTFGSGEPHRSSEWPGSPKITKGSCGFPKGWFGGDIILQRYREIHVDQLSHI